MAKKARTDDVAARIVEFIGRSMGELLNRKDRLSSELEDVEAQLASVRESVLRQLEGTSGAGAGRVRKAPVSVARKARREISPETRAKMAAAAKRRWAKARKGKAKP